MSRNPQAISPIGMQYPGGYDAIINVPIENAAEWDEVINGGSQPEHGHCLVEGVYPIVAGEVRRCRSVHFHHGCKGE